jgi:hypothetical protein
MVTRLWLCRLTAALTSDPARIPDAQMEQLVS